jgi:hypothetical protein
MAKGQYEPRVSHLSSPAPAKSTRSTSKMTEDHPRSSSRLTRSQEEPAASIVTSKSHGTSPDSAGELGKVSPGNFAPVLTDATSDDDSTHVPADASVPDVEVSSVGEQSMVIDDETILLYKRKAGKRSRVLSEDEVNAEAAMDISDEPDEGDIADSPRGSCCHPEILGGVLFVVINLSKN